MVDAPGRLRIAPDQPNRLAWHALDLAQAAVLRLPLSSMHDSWRHAMKMLFAADGSSSTKKALGFLVTHPALLEGGELVVLNVQPPLPPQVKGFVGASVVADYHSDEAAKVLAPIEEFLRRHELTFRTAWVVGQAGHEIVEACRREGAQMVVMGTHGYGLIGRTVMGSVAQRVLVESEVPVLLVK
jgi:nucleotide-binding universal stress UspA family protein